MNGRRFYDDFTLKGYTIRRLQSILVCRGDIALSFATGWGSSLTLITNCTAERLLNARGSKLPMLD